MLMQCISFSKYFIIKTMVIDRENKTHKNERGRVVEVSTTNTEDDYMRIVLDEYAFKYAIRNDLIIDGVVDKTSYVLVKLETKNGTLMFNAMTDLEEPQSDSREIVRQVCLNHIKQIVKSAVQMAHA